MSFDVLVIGGGIAGVSIGYELAATSRVCLLEMESTLAYHTTGRSAATWLGTYGNEPIRALTKASHDFLIDPPHDIYAAPLATPLGLLYIAGPHRADAIRELHAEVVGLTPDVTLVGEDVALAMNPLLRPGFVELAMVEPGALDVDVHELHQGYTRGLRQREAKIITSAKVASATWDGTAWTLATAAGETYTAPVVVNAAGAWCDELATILGGAAIGIQPLRRSIFMVPAHDTVEHLPMTFDIDHQFYFKHDSGQYLCSPADETLSPPGDAKPDELEIARAIEAINEATVLSVRHVRTAWAGLRSFTPDQTPAVGYDPAVPGLFWYAGQAGFGIQICPAMARLGAALVHGEPAPADVLATGLDLASLDPARFSA
jgi:D-arginine dehydrogenase